MSTPTPRPAPPLDMPHTASQAGSWVDNNWAGWLSAGLRIIFIVLIAVALRAVVRRTITRTIERMNRGVEAAANTTLGGLLVNAERRKQRSEAIGSVLRSVASFLIMGTAALTVLSVLQINLAPLLASAGVAGVAIGFGARNLVTDFLSGVFMILEDQYGVGDVIDAGEATGTVIEVGLRVTKLRGDNGEIWYVRNGEVKRIGNLSQGWATAVVDVQVGSGVDLERARSVIAATAEEMSKDGPWDEKLWEPVRILGLESVSADSVVIQTQAKTMPGEAATVARELRWRIKRAFDAEGIVITGGAASAADPAKDTVNALPLVPVQGTDQAPPRPSEQHPGQHPEQAAAQHPEPAARRPAGGGTGQSTGQSAGQSAGRPPVRRPERPPGPGRAPAAGD